MMLATEGNLQMLAGGLRVKARVQHPQVKPRKDRQGWPWIFRNWAEEIQSDGTVKTLRKYQAAGLSKGEGAITKKQAEIERDKFLAKLNAPTVEEAIEQVVATGVALFGAMAKMYRMATSAAKTKSRGRRGRKRNSTSRNTSCRSGATFRLNQIQPKAVEDWLHTTFDSWWTMHGVRAIMSRIFYYAEGHGLWEEGQAQPGQQGETGKETLQVRAPYPLVRGDCAGPRPPGRYHSPDHRNLHRHWRANF